MTKRFINFEQTPPPDNKLSDKIWQLKITFLSLVPGYEDVTLPRCNLLFQVFHPSAINVSPRLPQLGRKLSKRLKHG
ncbi:hypothetical protein TNCT_243251 [Trichonephila clavata]|uniref:Uncharacterized protein n=1 Tax=Trichonephila clavata TaxID=2740835 RepID=A0A8X6J126_TRICU|nr:hypothetical protein TNCT_243251 [Trichonephila clavata]